MACLKKRDVESWIPKAGGFEAATECFGASDLNPSLAQRYAALSYISTDCKRLLAL